jgi:hypothetical protein
MTADPAAAVAREAREITKTVEVEWFREADGTMLAYSGRCQMCDESSRQQFLAAKVTTRYSTGATSVQIACFPCAMDRQRTNAAE